MIERSVALHTIASPALDPAFPLYQHYPAMKLGVLAAVVHYARLLVPRAAAIMAGAPSLTWRICVPPRFARPAAASLLGRALGHALGLGVVEPRYAPPDPATAHLERPPADYSRATVGDRVAARRQLEGRGAPIFDAAALSGCGVLFVNDINVTGTQQAAMRRMLAPLDNSALPFGSAASPSNAGLVEPAQLCWLYVLALEPGLGAAHPELEHALNHLHLADFDAFAGVVAGPGIEHTARCIDRLLGHDVDAIERVLRAMPADRARGLLAHAADEVHAKASAAHIARVAELARRL